MLLKELIEQLSEGGKNVYEIEKARKRAEVEKEDLQMALEEAETTIEQQEGKYLRLQLEFSSLRQDFERKLHDKDEDFENTRRNHSKFIESIKTTLDAEVRCKNELFKQVNFSSHTLPETFFSFLLEKETRK